MIVRRLRWQGASRQRALETLLGQAFTSWAQAWSVSPANWHLRLAPRGQQRASEASWRWCRVSLAKGVLWLGAEARQLDRMGGLLAGAEPEDSLGLARRIGERALRSLLAQLAGATEQDIGVPTPVAPSADERSLRFGACAFLIEGPDIEATVWLDVDLCESHLPAPPAKPLDLLPLASAIAGQNVGLDVVLDLGQASLAETHGLQVGDVLVSGTPLDSRFALSVRGQPLAHARLYRRGQQRALLIESTPSSRTAS